MTISQMLFSLSGRINRAKYWLIALATIVAMLVLVTALYVLTLVFADDISLVPLIILILLYIPMLWVGIAVGVKRLHDRNKSGWWLLFFYLVPGVLQAIGGQFEEPVSLVLYLPAAAISIWMIVELGFLRGTPGPNQYGPDPLQTSA